jgi:hypothetical protein
MSARTAMLLVVDAYVAGGKVGGPCMKLLLIATQETAFLETSLFLR